MAELISVQTGTANSVDFTLAEGGAVSLLLKDGVNTKLPRGVSALIQIKTSEGVYMTIGQLTSDNPMQVLQGAGTYRVNKSAGAVAFGVDKT
jgi:hypothetical protein